MRARKRFGQHFLTDPRVLDGIVRALAPAAEDRVLEIGPGHGALTELLYEAVDSLVAVEIDRDLISFLRARFPRLEIVNEDILRVDLETMLAAGAWRLVGNLPYNISSPLLVRLYRHLHLIRDMHFMFQRELAERLWAEPGTKRWGRLSVVTQYHCRVERLLDVPPEAFSPPPKVHSQVVRLEPRDDRADVDARILNQVLTTAFSARRKRLSNALKDFALDWDAVGISPDLRPDQLGVAEYVRITDAVAESTGHGQ